MRSLSLISRTFLLLSPIFISVDSLAQYQVNGDANQISCNCYQLTEDVPFSGGSVWNVNQIDLNNPFNFYFDVWLDCSDWGADGIAFVLQPVNVTQGGGSSSLGYGGIVPSLAVEIDTWPNDVTMFDPPQDHIAIMQNGSANHNSASNLAGPVVASSTQANIEDCQWHQIRIVWEPSINTLAVFFDGVFRTSYTGNIINTIFGGNSMVYWGWTGGTGSESADQRFCNAILPNYEVTSNSRCVGDPIQFTNISNTSSGIITNFSWNFGDGATGTGAPVSHTYATAGTFDVELTITTEGCTEDTIIPITIYPTPVVDLGPDKNICIGQTVQLNSPNTLGSGTYTWSPTTALSNATAPSPTTSTASTINYTLTFTSSNGCSDSDVIQVVVNSLPVANAGPDQILCEGEQLTLQASGGVTYGWTPAASLNNASVAAPTASPSVTTTYTVTVTDANNCTATDAVTIDVMPAPVLNAGADANVCEGDVVQLNATGTGTFSWSPGTGLSSTTIANPTASPTTTVTYGVTLTDANNCSSTDSVTVDVDPIPVADFPDPVAVCNGNAVQFNDNSTGSIVAYNWDFGDGEIGQGPNPTHVYPDIGVYNVTLTTISANGCSDVTTGTAEVIDGPIPVFSIVNGPELCEQETLQLVNNSFGPIVTYDWDFGDGSTGSGMNPNFAFSSHGSYTVSLTVGTADQCFNTLTADVEVHPIPVVDFTSTPACFGETTSFTDQSTIPVGVVNGWEWTFGDGSGIAYGQTPDHTYNAQGAYTVRLISQSAMGCRDTLEKTVHVSPTPVAAISVADVCQGDDAMFTNSTVPNNSTIAQWNWNFGNGQTATEFEPVHQYGSFGTFNVMLTAVSDSGCVGEASTIIEVFPYPTAAFAFSDDEGCAPVAVSFTDQSTVAVGYSIGSYQWNFGDGAMSATASPQHIYVATGSYDVSLIVTTAGGGCVDTLTLPGAMSIFVTPTASFNHRPTDATMLDPRIRFTNTTANGVEYEWDFGDGGSSIDVNPVNTYLAEGDYLVTLVAIHGSCSDTLSQFIHIDPETFIYIPNAFTPNGNRLNDGFMAKGIGIEKFEMSIFNKWGEELYYTSTMDQPWNGIHNGRELPTDSYVYRIDIVNVKGESKRFLGSVNLIR